MHYLYCTKIQILFVDVDKRYPTEKNIKIGSEQECADLRNINEVGMSATFFKMVIKITILY